MTEVVAVEKKIDVRPACPKPCSSCPWRVANQGSKPDPHKFYTPANLARLWRGLRNGTRMSCHPTDPRMAEFEGYEALADREVIHECAGALTLQQRELMTFQTISDRSAKGQALKEYRRQRPNGLTRSGLIALVERAVFGGTALDRVAMGQPDLVDAEIGYDLIGRLRKTSCAVTITVAATMMVTATAATKRKITRSG